MEHNVNGFICTHDDESETSVGVFENQEAFIIRLKRPITDEMLQFLEVKTQEALVADSMIKNVFFKDGSIVRELILRPETFYALAQLCVKVIENTENQYVQ